MLQYRKEIDGLRAVAVVPVILFHAGVQSVSGGYVGVDVFFVISGYLITSLILQEKATGTFSLARFYERRARRILPALSFMLLSVTVLAYVLLSPSLLRSYSASLASVATFSSNIYFYKTTGYFFPAAEESPLLHTWSLAIEEQFYLFFPLMILLLWRLGKKRLFFSILVVAAGSLLLAQRWSTAHVAADFYLIPTRAWELFAGAIIAFLATRIHTTKRIYAEGLSITGLALILYAIFRYDDHTPFPSSYTLVPVLGTILVIVYGTASTYVGRLLSLRLVVFVGLLSYSLYLWHQPLFAFIRVKSSGPPPAYLFALAIVCAGVLAYLSYRYIERPFRSKQRFSQTSIFRFAGGTIALFLALGVIGYVNNGFVGRFETVIDPSTIVSSPKRKVCHTSGTAYLPPSRACRYFGQNITWAILGDSHTVEIGYALAEQLKTRDQGLVHLSFSGCPPALKFDSNVPGCSKWLTEAVAYLEKEPSVKNVLVGFRYSAALFGSQLASYPEVPNGDPGDMFSTDFKNQVGGDAEALYWNGFLEIVHRLLNAGKTVYVLYPIPELPASITKVEPFSALGGPKLFDLDRATSVSYYGKRNEFILNKLATLPYSDHLVAVRPDEILRHGDYFTAVLGDKALYYDDNHLSLAGATLVAKDIMTKILTASSGSSHSRELSSRGR